MATVDQLMKNAVDARRVAQRAMALAVREARAADWSWDRISTALGGTPNGETLRRNFGAEDPFVKYRSSSVRQRSAQTRRAPALQDRPTSTGSSPRGRR